MDIPVSRNMLGLTQHSMLVGNSMAMIDNVNVKLKKSGYILHGKDYNHRNNMATTELNGSGEKAAQEKAKGPQRTKHNAVSCFAGGRLCCLGFFLFFACFFSALNHI